MKTSDKDSTFEVSPSHFLHYVLREIVEVDYSSPDAHWFKEHQPDDQGFDATT